MARIAPARVATRTTTVRLPRPLYEQAKCIVEKEKGLAGQSISLNDLIVTAIKSYVRLYERRQIDAQFAGMAKDAVYQKEARLLAEEFEHSDWESLGLEEADLEEAPIYAASSR